MSSDKRKLELVKEAIHDWRYGDLTAFSAMIAISTIVDPRKPSKECAEWARKVIAEREY